MFFPLLIFLSCYSSPYFNPDKPHHTRTGFQNTDPELPRHGLGAFLRWIGTRWKNPTSLDPKDYTIPFAPSTRNPLEGFQGRWSVTWIGHATTLIHIDGFNILTDPIWSERCSPVSFAGPKRYTPPGIAMENLPRIHAVVISHNHYDHMDIPSLQELDKRFSPRFFVGLGNRKLLEENGIRNVTEMDWWDRAEVTLPDANDSAKRKDSSLSLLLTVHFTPTQHFSARGILDRDRTLWGSFVLETRFLNSLTLEDSESSTKIYFAGDTGYFSGFKEIGERWGRLDLAILPIGAYEPRWFMAPVHVSPEQSVQAFSDLQAKYMLPMHYNTFVLSDEPLDEPLQLTQKAMREMGIPMNRLLNLVIGETYYSD